MPRILIEKVLKPWKLLSSRLVFDHKWYKLRQDVVQLPDGRRLDDYFVSVRDDVVVVYAMTTEGEVLLVRQYKHGAQEILTELPAGFFDISEESPLEAAKRELLEETGFVSDDWHPLAQTIDNPTKDSNRFYLFLAKECRRVSTQQLDENEDIALLLTTPQELPEMIQNGDIKVHSMIATIYLAQNVIN
jgi:ADP-ribose pyrophosphatase